jgi:hypothetical protein
MGATLAYIRVSTDGMLMCAQWPIITTLMRGGF